MSHQALSADTEVVLLLCGRFGGERQEPYQPLPSREYSEFTKWLNVCKLRPANLMTEGGRYPAFGFVLEEAGVELVTCPVHGEHMVLRRKSNPQGGLLDTFFLAYPHWRPGGDGCSFIEKLKSGPQLAALLKSQTGLGIL